MSKPSINELIRTSFMFASDLASSGERLLTMVSILAQILMTPTSRTLKFSEISVILYYSPSLKNIYRMALMMRWSIFEAWFENMVSCFSSGVTRYIVRKPSFSTGNKYCL